MSIFRLISPCKKWLITFDAEPSYVTIDEAYDGMSSGCGEMASVHDARIEYKHYLFMGYVPFYYPNINNVSDIYLCLPTEDSLIYSGLFIINKEFDSLTQLTCVQIRCENGDEYYVDYDGMGNITHVEFIIK